MLRLDRPGFRAAARAETGVEPRSDGDLEMPFVAALGDREWARDGVPLTEGLSEVVDDLAELPGVPGLRVVADMVADNDNVERQMDGWRTDKTSRA
jgi:hypothetical protein